jgi:integrase
MPQKSQVPSYRLHKARKCAVVTINGRNHYLGPFGSPESHARYAAKIAEWQRTQALSPPAKSSAGPSFTIGQLALAYQQFCLGYYVKNGQPTSQIHTENAALRALVELYETEQAADFGPLKLKNIQQHLIGRGLSRSTINQLVAAIKRAFKWAASEERISAAVFHALETVSGLKAGRCGAREPEPIEPVPEPTVLETLKFLSPVVQAMIRLQLLTGMRPGEVCLLRPCDVTMQMNGAWVYRPASHKTEHHDRERRIYIGPEGREVLRPFLDRESEGYCFSPRDSDDWRRAQLRANRKSKLTPSQLARKPKSNPRRKPGGRFTVASYRRAIERGCEAAFGMPKELRKPPKSKEQGPKETEPQKVDRLRLAANWRRQHCWNPNQLRHSRATTIREKFGVEAAQVVLGHSDPRITQIYAEKNFDLAAKVMQQIG